MLEALTKEDGWRDLNIAVQAWGSVGNAFLPMREERMPQNTQVVSETWTLESSVSRRLLSLGPGGRKGENLSQ